MNEQSPPTAPEPADGTPSASVWRFDNCEFDALEPALRVAGKPVTVEPRPLRLLAELLQHCNEVLTKEELLETVWEGRPTVDHVLANAVSKLRTALGEAGAARLQTVPRVGYRFVGPVQRIEHSARTLHQQAGQGVPGREGFVLERPLGRTVDAGVWLARHAKLGHSRVFKFAQDGARLVALKREYTLFRLLQRELGPREDIVQLVDANFAHAPFWLESEFAGPNLLEWAQAGPPGGHLATLALPERLGLFVQIAQAVGAAHSVGVLHKDIKPANVLISGEPGAWQPRLTDFGSGRLLAALREAGISGLSLAETAPEGPGSSGTPGYIAPELLRGQAATVQSDVYALGVLLLQLALADCARYPAPGWEREVEDPLLRADIARATDGTPAERFASVAELAAAVAQWPQRRAAAALQQQEQALRAVQAAQAQRRLDRRPWLWGVSAAVLGGLVVSTALWLRAESALQESRRQAARAEAINLFLKDDVLNAEELGRSRSGRALTLVDVLTRASQAAAQRFEGAPETEATVRLQIAQSQARLRNMLAAAAEYERALVLWRGLRPAADAERLLTQLGLSSALYAMTRPTEAQALLAEALPLAQGHVDARVQHAALRVRYDAAVAGRDMATALQAAQALLAWAEAGGAQRRPEAIEALLLQAEMHYQLGQMPQAEQVLLQLAAAPLQAAAAGPVLRARVLMHQARQLANRGERGPAEALLLEGRRLLQDSVGEADYLYGVLQAELASLYAQDRPEQAAAALGAALHALRSSLGPDHLSVRMTQLNLAFIELGFGDVAQALARMDEARPWFAAQPGGPSAQLLQAIDFRRATALTLLKRPAEALALLEGIDSGALAQASWGEDWPHRLQAERALALHGLGQRAQALGLMTQAVQGMQGRCSNQPACDGYAGYLQHWQRPGSANLR